VSRRKTTVYLDEDVLRAAKVTAARTGRHDYEIVEEALRRYLGFDIVDRVRAANAATAPSEDELLAQMYDEIDAVRAAGE
jgi:Arc/MetJ family transcription regulator